MESSHLFINEDNKSNLFIIAKWLKFFAILMFFASGFMILLAISMFTLGGSSSFFDKLGMGDSSFGLIGLGILYLLIALVSIYPALYMFRSSKDLKQALLENSQTYLDSGFKNLKSYYRFTGILSIVFIGVYIFAILAGIGFAGYNMSNATNVGVEFTQEVSESDTSNADSVVYSN
jgi:hypothetical protein